MVNAGLFLINLLTRGNGGSWSFVWPLAAWGIAVVINTLVVFAGVFTEGWKQRKAEELVKQLAYGPQTEDSRLAKLFDIATASGRGRRGMHNRWHLSGLKPCNCRPGPLCLAFLSAWLYGLRYTPDKRNRRAFRGHFR